MNLLTLLLAAGLNLGEGDLALKGYDPVAYFDGMSARGRPQLSHSWGGATYRFTSEANRERFKRSPERYAPAYGGWCATALVNGQLVDIDPGVFRVRGDDLFLFVSDAARDTWLAKETANVRTANASWNKRGGKRFATVKGLVRATGHWNLKNGLALQGYDPVSYFDGKPRKGDAKLGYTRGGVTYHFASAANRARFKGNPERYEPAYGGWCAYAVGKAGKKVKIDPEAYLIRDGRLLVFFRNRKLDTRKPWRKDEATLAPAADRKWRKLSRR